MKTRHGLPAWLSLALCALHSSTAVAAAGSLADTRPDDLRPRVVAVEDRAVVLTPAALYRFRPDAETWLTLTAENGLPPPPLLALSLTGGELWVAGAGASVSGAEVDDWQYYPPGQGFPSPRAWNIESDEDYAYAATDSGAARFDRYIREWERLPPPPARPWGQITDVAVGSDRVWFALDGGVAELRKQSELTTVDSLLGDLRTPQVLALRLGSRYLWAICAEGLARYDLTLETWTSYAPGVDIPDTRVHQATLLGEDLWLGTDDGLWRYRGDQGIWRRHESSDAMPGRSVFAFSIENGLWVVTERAFACYDDASNRWIDFTTSIPISPGEKVDLAWVGTTLILLGETSLVYAAAGTQNNPSLFPYRELPLEYAPAAAETPSARWRLELADTGLGLRRSAEEFLAIKGGTTVYIEDDDAARKPGENDFESLAYETRSDLTLNGRLWHDRTLSGLYDTTNPDNESYLISFRGTRTDLLRHASAGEIDLQPYNTNLLGGCGLRGGSARIETGQRSAATHRRLLTADGWVGRRRTLSGHEVFYGREALYRLGHQNLVANSERISLDRELLQVGTDYTIDWEHGLFLLGEHLLLDDQSTVEVSYDYEIGDEEPRTAAERLDRQHREVYAAQLGLAPCEPLFVGLSGVAWQDSSGRRTWASGLSTRLEYRDEASFVRITPEIVGSWLDANHDPSGGSNANDPTAGDPAAPSKARDGLATGIGLRGRYHALEVAGTLRSLTDDYRSLENRATRLGRLREEARLSTRLDVGAHVQGTLDWNQTLSDRIPMAGDDVGDSTAAATTGHGRESLLMAGVRYLRNGLPNIGLRHGRVTADSLGAARTKEISRGEIEVNPDPAHLRALGIRRLWLRSFVQRNDARSSAAAGARRITDQSFVRFNGSTGNPLSWNIDWEDRWTHRPQGVGSRGLHRAQELDATLQSQAHPAFDAFANWRAARDLRWRDQGGPGGFDAERRLTTSTHLYPGRIAAALVPLSLQIDLSRSGREEGAEGETLPGAQSLWRAADQATQRQWEHLCAIESRLKALAWLQLIDRWEGTRTKNIVQAGREQARRDRFENRVEIHPSGGILTVRLIGERRRSEATSESLTVTVQRMRRLIAEWDQTWGHGVLTSALLDGQQTDVGRPLDLRRWSPQTRLTYRWSPWRLDATLGAIFVYEESFGSAPLGQAEPRVSQRTLALSSTCSVQPLRVLTLKVLYQADCREHRRTDHTLDLRIMIRA